MGCGKRETGVRKKADYKILFQQLVDDRENLEVKINGKNISLIQIVFVVVLHIFGNIALK